MTKFFDCRSGVRQEVIDSLLDTFEYEPSNLTMIKEYERIAKTHINKYFETFNMKEKKHMESLNMVDDMIGPRKYSIYANQKKQVVFESLALQFIGRLQNSFLDFKNYCASINNLEEDCAIIDTDWNSILESIE